MTDTFDWQGKVGDVWAVEWQRTDRSFTELSKHLLEAILARAPEGGRAVDIGCGAGEMAIGLARARPGLTITGVDLSAELINVAQARAGDADNLQLVQGDAVAAAGEHAPVDLYISRHGVMFFDDSVAAFTAFRDAASPGGNIVFSCFRDWTLNAFAYEIGQLADGVAPKTGAPGPFAFADKDEVAAMLKASGWTNIEAEAIDFGYVAGQGDDPVADAMSFMRRIGPASRAITDAPEDKRQALIDGLRRICEKYRQGNAVLLPAAAWIWSATA